MASSRRQRGPGSARASAGDHQRALRRPKHLDRSATAAGSGGTRRGGWPHPFIKHELRRHMRAQDVGGDLYIDRPWLAGIAQGARNRLVEFAHHLLGDAQSTRRRVTGRRISTCGMSCSGPILACGREVQPPISKTGARASDALAIAVTVLVTPGPAVTIATPNCRSARHGHAPCVPRRLRA